MMMRSRLKPVITSRSFGGQGDSGRGGLLHHSLRLQIEAPEQDHLRPAAARFISNGTFNNRKFAAINNEWCLQTPFVFNFF
jgi:hypothetical protein